MKNNGNGWGGHRPGSGRKKAEKRKESGTTSITGSPEEIQRLKDNAAAAGQSVSRYVLDRLAGEKNEKKG